MWVNQQKTKIDHLLPVSVKREPIMLQLPSAYVAAISLLIFLDYASPHPSTVMESCEVPALRADIEYFDIGDLRHRTSFDIKLSVNAAFMTNDHQLSSFNGVLEFEKLT